MFFSSPKQVVSIPNNRSFSQIIELLVELIKRDLKAKYKNTFLGICWVILQPLILAIIFVLIKKEITQQFTINQLGYLDMFVVLIPWQFFVTALQRSADCITANNNLIYRIKFPIILLPLSVIMSAFIDVVVNIIIYFFIMLMLKKLVFYKILLLFLVLLISGIFISSLCILFALLQCFIADLRQTVPFLTKLSLFALPLLYNENSISESIRAVYIYIPLVWMISKTKEIIEVNYISSSGLTISILLIGVFSFIASYLIFKKTQPIIVDYI